MLAQNLNKEIEVIYRDIKIYVDDEIIIPKDAVGRTIEPFIYEGATYSVQEDMEFDTSNTFKNNKSDTVS